MKNKLSKSILATGLATAGFVVGTNHVQADTVEGTTPTNPEKSTEASATNANGNIHPVSNVDQSLAATDTSKEEKATSEVVTEELLQVAQDQVEEANKQVSDQVNVTENLASQLKDAESKVDAARQEVATREQNQKDATPENIEAAKETVKTAEAAVTARQEDVKLAREEEAKAAEEVHKQTNVVAAKQTLVDVAKENITKAEAPIKNEKVALEDAQKAVETAKADVAAKQANLQTATDAVANRDKTIAQARQSVAAAEQKLTATNVAIAQKEAELQQAKATPAVSSEYSYTNFLDYLQSQVTDPAYANLANQAKAEYAKHNSVNNSNSGSYENALAAVRILREVNKARLAAGLNELYINPFISYESQIQLEATRSRMNSGNPHTGIYNYNENLAWGGSPEWAVNFWQGEKSAYQKVAQQHGTPTNETQLDANALYLTLGQDFYAVGHYLQNMSNKFNLATTAYSSVGEMSQISFKSISDLQSLINAGVAMTVDQYEAKLREFAAALKSGVSSNTSKVQAELNALKAQATSDTSRLTMAKAELNAQLQAKSTDATSLAQAQQALTAARSGLNQATNSLTQQEQIYHQAYNRIAASVAPLQGVLKTKEADLAEAKVVLARLENAYAAAQSKTAGATQALANAQQAVKDAQQKVDDLQNAPQELEKAKTALTDALMEYKTLAASYQKELQHLSDLQATYAKLLATYQELQAKYDQLHPEQVARRQHPSITAVEGLAYHGTAAEKTTPLAKKVTSKTAGKKVLPSTGTNSNDALLLAGMALGAASLAVVSKRKED